MRRSNSGIPPKGVLMKTRRWLWLAATVSAGCGGYYAPNEVVYGSAVYTQAAPTADFKPLRRYYLDLTMEVWKDGVQQPSTSVPPAGVETVHTRMTAYGYTESQTIPLPGTDAVGLRAAVFNNSYSFYYNYCSIYWGYYGCYPTWGYAGTYSTGTVALTMVDLRTAPPPGGQRQVLWVSALYAVLTGAGQTAQFNSALNRAFDQSPYLKTSSAP
jgi:hypothetical protein